MSIAQQISPTARPGRTAGKGSFAAGHWGLLLALAVLIAILAMPTPVGLPVAGHRMLAVFGFAVVVWITEAVDYAISATIIAALMAFLLGTAPSVTNPKVLIGTSSGLATAMS